jgi:ribosome-associated protein
VTAPGSEGVLEVGPGVTIAAADVTFSFSRSSGPGGQAVNKLCTRAELRVAVETIDGLSELVRQRFRDLAGRRLNKADEIVIVAETERSQLDNRRECVKRLGDLVTQALAVPKKRRPTRPSRSSIEKRLETKRQKSGRKQTRRKPDTDD